MQINLNKVGKRYNQDWIFRNCSYSFSLGKKYAITGPNGSGKSTLLQIIAASILHNEGDINFIITDGKECSPENIYQYISLVTPSLELIEEMTTNEFLAFHSSFKELVLPIADIINIVGLKKSTNKQIRYFSSGMKQRLKLAQAFFSNTPVLLLDEPTSNLDVNGTTLYHQLINQYTKDRLVIISSNDTQEYSFCEAVIDIRHYKPQMI